MAVSAAPDGLSEARPLSSPVALVESGISVTCIPFFFHFLLLSFPGIWLTLNFFYVLFFG